jgi:hypothetical protein
MAAAEPGMDPAAAREIPMPTTARGLLALLQRQEQARAAAALPPPRGGDKRQFVSPFMFENPPAYKPLPVYRPELPGAQTVMAARVERLQLPAAEKSQAAKDYTGVAPPWYDCNNTIAQARGRMRIDPATRQIQFDPLSKKSVDRELHIVRDKGLQRRVRTVAGARLSAAQQAFVRAIPSTGPLVQQSMRQAPGLPSSSLR